MDDLVLSTTTDPVEVAEAVVDGLPGRIEAPAPAKELKYTPPPNSRIDSWEHPQSERAQLLARLEAAEQDLEQAENQTIVVNQAAGEQESQPPVDMDEVRRRATEAAIAEGQRRLNQPQFANAYDVEIAKLSGQFQAKLEAIKPDNFEALVQNAHRQGVDITPAIRDALLVSPEGPQVLVRLLEHPEELQKLAQATDQHTAAYAIGRMAGSLSQPRQRAISNAPAPIRPLSGSDTKSSVPPDQMSFQDYRRWRDQSEKARFRR
jgi:hypothetical protein